MSREQALSLDTFDGRTRLGRFRDNLMAFGALATEGTDDFDVSWLVELFKRAGVATYVLDVAPRRGATIGNLAEAVVQRKIPIQEADVAFGFAFWRPMTVGYIETGIRLLMPGQEGPESIHHAAFPHIVGADENIQSRPEFQLGVTQLAEVFYGEFS